MLLERYQPVLRIPANTQGRDFVVGDVHGSYRLLKEALAEVRFAPGKDRLLLSGDLGDRGPDSRRCMELLREYWALSVRGNHEQMALDAFAPDGGLPTDVRTIQRMVKNGMAWWFELSKAERLALLRQLELLPFAIEVETLRGTVGIIHAEVPPGLNWQQFTDGLERGDNEVMESCIWGRTRLTNPGHGGVPGIGRVFVGHTPQWGLLRRLGNIYAIDTGGVFGEQGAHPDGCLSVTNIVARTVSVSAPRRLPLLNLLDEPVQSEEPFGSGPGYEIAVAAELQAKGKLPWLAGRR